MCGILFCYDKEKRTSLSKFHKSLQLQNHRGPDDDNIFYYKHSGSETFNVYKGEKEVFPLVSLGHKRLSILDLSSNSKQPLIQNNNFLMYNGEFYNFKDFANKQSMYSDTITLFNNLVKYGYKFLKNINGMWGIVFGDWKKKIIISRDRFGKKPLYYYKDHRYFIVSSEIKSIYNLLGIKRKINKQKLSFYLLGRLSPFPNSEETFYSQIFSVKPGQILEFDFRKGSLKEIDKLSLSDLDNGFDNSIFKNQNKLIEQIQKDIYDSIKLRLQSDVKVGVQLSGGVDSSIISSVVRKHDDFSDKISYFTCDILNNKNELTSDTYYSRELAKQLKVKLNEVKIDCNSERTFFKYADQIHKSTELPTNLFLATIPTYLLAKAMNKKKIKVSLDGVGGDEIMGGYPSFESLIIANIRKARIIEATSLFLNWKKFSENKNTNFLIILKRSFFNRNSPLCHDNISMIYKSVKDKDILNNMNVYDDVFYKRENFENLHERQIFEVNKYQIPYYLGISDALNMKWNIENRSPFLDIRLFKYIQMERKSKINNGFNKFILRKAFEKIVPRKIIWRKEKQGMRSSFTEKVLESKKIKEMILDSSFIKNIFLSEKIEKNLIKKPSYIKQLLPLAILDNIYKIKI